MKKICSKQYLNFSYSNIHFFAKSEKLIFDTTIRRKTIESQFNINNNNLTIQLTISKKIIAINKIKHKQ